MKSLLFALVIFSAVLFGLHALPSTPVLADSHQNDVITNKLCEREGAFGSDACNPDNLFTSDDSLAKRILSIFVYVIGGVSVIVVVIAGLMYVVSGGDSNSVQRAKNTLLYALIGLTVALFAQAIVAFILSS